MKLRELLKLMDTGDENTPSIQIVGGRMDWDQFDQVRIDSELLQPFRDTEVDCIAVEDGILRVGLKERKVCTLLHLCL